MYTTQGPFIKVGEHYVIIDKVPPEIRDFMLRDGRIVSIPVSKMPYVFLTVVSQDGVIAWEPYTEQQRINPQYRDEERNVPVRINEVLERDVARLLVQVISFQTKQIPPLEDAVRNHSPLVEQILEEFREYNLLRHVYSSRLPNIIQNSSI